MVELASTTTIKATAVKTPMVVMKPVVDDRCSIASVVVARLASLRHLGHTRLDARGQARASICLSIL